MLPSLGTLKTVGSGLYNMGRGTLFMGASQGATRTGKIMNVVGHAAPLAPAAVGSFKATSQQPSFQPQSTVKTSQTNVPLWADVGAGALTGGLAGAGSDFVGNAYMMASDHGGGVGQTLRDLPKALTVTPHLYADPSSGVFRQFGLARTAAGATIGAGVGAVRHALRKKESSSRGELHPVVERAIRAKLASGPGWHRPVNALSYAAFMAPYLSQRVHDNKPLTTALNTAGILGLSATSADSLAHGDGLAGYDLAGLGLMGAGMIHGALQPKHAF